MLHNEQPFPFFGPGQQHFPRDRLHKLRVGVEKEDVVKAAQSLLLLQENLKSAQCGKRPGVGLLRADMHAGVLLPRQSVRIGEHKIVYLAVAQQVLLRALVKFRPEHRILAGGNIQRRNLRHHSSAPRVTAGSGRQMGPQARRFQPS